MSSPVDYENTEPSAPTPSKIEDSNTRQRSVSESDNNPESESAKAEPTDEETKHRDRTQSNLESSKAHSHTLPSVLDENTIALTEGHQDLDNSLLSSLNELEDVTSLAIHEPLKHSSQGATGSDLTERLSPNTTTLGCEMCTNYEMQLQQKQEQERSLKKQQTVSQSLADRYHTELLAERVMRTELESKMIALNQSTDDKIQQLTETIKSLEETLNKAQEIFSAQLKTAAEEAGNVMKGRRDQELLIQAVQEKYQRLLGSHRKAAMDMQQEAIDLPQDVEELQLTCLTLREELIEAKAAKEHLTESMQSEMLVLRDQIAEEQSSRENQEADLMEEINALRTQLGIAQSHVNDARLVEDANRRAAEFQTTISDLESKLGSLQHEKGELEFELKESQKKVKMLQGELDTGEAVQRDFVKLSQSLQIELEKIRQSEQEVRWQFDEDVYACGGCQSPFSRPTQKLHCRHCGKVFCDDCLNKTVNAGPQRRPARVCQICHTLLCRDIPPYFSQSLPSNNNSKKQHPVTPTVS